MNVTQNHFYGNIFDTKYLYQHHKQSNHINDKKM